MKQNTTIQSPETLLQRMERLLFDDPDFIELQRQVQRQDKHIFRVICREFDELTFSRTLKYFLDPSEEHNLGSKLLRRFLNIVITSDEEYYRAKGISRLSVDLLNLDDANVYREYTLGELGRVDIFAELPNELALLVEAKLLSGEGDTQTTRYEAWVTQQKNRYKRIICVFLTPKGVLPESSLFTSISFSDLHTLLQSGDFGHTLNDHNRYIYNNLLRWIEELKIMDPNLQGVCRSIYRKYKLELDLIFNNIPSLSAFYKDLVDYINRTYSTTVLAHSGTNWITISPIVWMKHKELTPARKYSLPRVEYVGSEETQSFVFVIPQQGDIHDRALTKAKEIFGKEAGEVQHYKNWGQEYFYLRPAEPFIPENIIDQWNETVRKYGAQAQSEAMRIANILAADYLLKK